MFPKRIYSADFLERARFFKINGLVANYWVPFQWFSTLLAGAAVRKMFCPTENSTPLGWGSGQVGHGAQASPTPRCRAFSGRCMQGYRVGGCAAPDALQRVLRCSGWRGRLSGVAGRWRGRSTGIKKPARKRAKGARRYRLSAAGSLVVRAALGNSRAYRQ